MIDNIFIKNFRRIKEADIELKKGLTVLVGQNGSGKSTVIEAIIFNLYGKTKAGTKKETIRSSFADEEDQTYTSIDFTIMDVHYRCRRWMTKKGSVMATLYSYTDEEYEKILSKADKTLLDKTIGTEVANSATGVTSAIMDILGVTYDGFCASFIAKQKELDSLATLTLENRKKFFLDLLGYSKLDSIKPEINKELRSRQQSVNILDKQSLSTADITRQIRDAEKKIAELEKRIDKGTKMLSTEEVVLATAEADYSKYVVLQEKLSSAQSVLEKDKTDLATKKAEIERLDLQIKENEKKSEGYDENNSITDQLIKVRDELDKAKAFATAKTDKEKLEGSQFALRNELNKLSKTVADLRKKTEKEPDLMGAQSRLTEAKNKLSVIEMSISQANMSVTSFKDLLDKAESGAVAKCPTCGTSVSSEEGKSHLANELSAAQALVSKYGTEKTAAEENVQKCDAEVTSVRQMVRSWQTDKSTLQTTEKELEIYNSRVSEDSAKIAELAAYIATHAEDERTTAVIIKLGDENARLLAQSQRENEMKTAYFAAKSDKAMMEEIKKQIADIEKRIVENEAFCKENAKVPALFNDACQRKTESKAKTMKYRSFLNDLNAELSGYRSSIVEMNKQKALSEKQANDLAELLKDIESYSAAKDVVEYLREKLPSKIAPKLGFEASKLLAIATNGMYTMLEIDDNYEVYVYTDSEIRPISLMSGGEQDTISLCIRIAISKMILETSGVKEQTFILDEIFGSLDEDRRAAACDALRHLGESLSKIMCITHIDEIKDMADWTFVVERDENGISTVREIVEPNVMEMMTAVSEEHVEDKE